MRDLDAELQLIKGQIIIVVSLAGAAALGAAGYLGGLPGIVLIGALLVEKVGIAVLLKIIETEVRKS